MLNDFERHSSSGSKGLGVMGLSVADLGVRGTRPTPLAQIFFIFMQFSGKIAQIIRVGAPSRKSWICHWLCSYSPLCKQLGKLKDDCRRRLHRLMLLVPPPPLHQVSGSAAVIATEGHTCYVKILSSNPGKFLESNMLFPYRLEARWPSQRKETTHA